MAVTGTGSAVDDGEAYPPVQTSSLAAKLAFATLGFCLVFTLLAVGVRTWSAWQAQQAAMRGELAQLVQVFHRTLAKAIWEMDPEALQAHVDSAAAVASVGRVRLSMGHNGTEANPVERQRAGWRFSARVPMIEQELLYEPYSGAREVVGHLRLEGDERVLWSRLREELAAIVITQVIQSLLLAGLIMWVFNRYVTVHVRQVARHLEQLSPATLGRPLRLLRTSKQHDELSLLAHGVNQLQLNLADYLDRQQRDEQELTAHRDRLADLVRERTAALEEANVRLENLSRRDGLTGLFNRRHFDEIKDIEFSRATRGNLPLSLILCDVDHFKRYNDIYGHAAGDVCLKSVAQALGGCFGRAGEVVARIGGEEFAVLLPGSSAAQAMAGGERIRQAIAALAMEHAGSDVAQHVTLSIGTAEIDHQSMVRFDELFHEADAALYRAKQRGRNCVSS
jgi:diguanylate cyclase (GGDEF)-like protein